MEVCTLNEAQGQIPLQAIVISGVASEEGDDWGRARDFVLAIGTLKRCILIIANS
jgi:hypothetical protein